MVKPVSTPKPPKLSAITEPDLVDRIFDYIFSDPVLAQAIHKNANSEDTSVAKLKSAVRAEFKGDMCYIAGRPASDRQALVSKILSSFNGRNATEVARVLGVGRSTVYRYLKQPGKAGTAKF